MKKTISLFCVILLGSSMGFAKKSTKSISPSKITCTEFLGLDETIKPRLVYFLEGVSKSGKVEDAMIEVDEVSAPVLWVMDECKKTPKQSLWSKVKAWAKNETKKL